MLTAILIISILNFIFIIIGMREQSNQITKLEITIDEIKEKTDKLGTHTYK